MKPTRGVTIFVRKNRKRSGGEDVCVDERKYRAKTRITLYSIIISLHKTGADALLYSFNVIVIIVLTILLPEIISNFGRVSHSKNRASSK